jgi:putative tricarboxylic transport membrane protein
MTAKIQKLAYIFFFAIGVLYLVGALLLPVGTLAAPKGGLFPLMVAAFLIAMSIALLADFLKGKRGAGERIEGFPEGKDRNRVLAVGVALVLYSVFLKPLGYLVSTVGLMGVIVHLLGLRGWVKVALAAILTGVLSYYLFAVILEVPLPRGEVFP